MNLKCGSRTAVDAPCSVAVFSRLQKLGPQGLRKLPAQKGPESRAAPDVSKANSSNTNKIAIPTKTIKTTATRTGWLTPSSGNVQDSSKQSASKQDKPFKCSGNWRLNCPDLTSSQLPKPKG